MYKLSKYLDIVKSIHDSPFKLTYVSSGGGTNAISSLLEVPGASNTILESYIPYSKESMNTFLNKEPDHYCSLDSSENPSNNTKGRRLWAKRLKYIILISFLILSFQKLSIANNISSEVDKISKNLRCLICQGQSVYDSQSDFALSMKILIKNKLEEGKSEKQIYDYLKNQYGEWIVYDPEFNKKNIVLWIFPLILFIFGGLLIYRKVFIK